MNIMLVVPWDQEFGGVASVVGNLAQRLERRGHRVIFLHPGASDRCRQRVTKWGFTGYEINLRPPFIRDHPVKSVIAFVVYFARTMYQIGSVMRAHGIQVVNVHYPVDASVYFGVLRRLLPIRLALSVHGADLFPDGRRMERYSWSIKLLVSASDVLIAPSKAFLRDCLSVFPRSAKKGVFVHNGIDITEFKRTEERGGTAEVQPYLLCIAAHNQKKGLDVLVKAFAQVSKTRCGLRLLLVGDGPLRRQHEELARSLAIEGRVKFLGERGRSEVAQLMHDCTMFVLPSRSEPFGMVVAEALACRKAVVASAVGGIPEIIENGRSGVLVQPDDPGALARALVTMLEDEAFRGSIADAGYERVLEHFGCEKMGARYEDVYSALLNGCPIRVSDIAVERHFSGEGEWQCPHGPGKKARQLPPRRKHQSQANGLGSRGQNG